MEKLEKWGCRTEGSKGFTIGLATYISGVLMFSVALYSGRRVRKRQ